jgi:hypothetical protein
VVFETVTYQGFDEIRAIIDSLANELADKSPGRRTALQIG